MTPAGDADEVVVGRIGRPHGVRGEVTVDVRTDFVEQRFAAGSVLGAGPRRRLVVSSAREHGGRLLVRFDGVDERTAAEQLRGTLLTVEADELPPIDDPDEFYDHQLAGLAAVDDGGEPLGTVRAVLHAPAHDLLVVDTEAGTEVLVPFVAAMVPEVDVPAGRVVLTPPAGLFDES